MSILRASFFLFVYFFTVFVKAQQPASDVFVDFVIEQLEFSEQVAEFEEIMGSDWIDEITLYTASWSGADAERFLKALKISSVESEDILKILQAGSYLQALHAGRLNFQFVEEVGRRSSASDIFFDFVTEQLESSGQIEEFEEIMGSGWIDKIILYTASWNGADAEYFLSVLKGSGVEPKYILKLLQAGSFLQALQAGRLHFEFQVATQGIEVATAEVIDQSISPAVEVVFPEQLKFSEFAFLNSPLTNEGKGHDVIIQFVNASREYLGSSDFDRIMGRSWDQSVWESRLIRYMNEVRYMNEGGWMGPDAKNFVLFLVGRIGLENTLKRIKSNASYFEQIAYLGFSEKVFFYDGFLGEEVVNELLIKSLGGFTNHNSLSELRDIISFIHKYIENEEELRAFVKKGIINIARVIYSNLIGIEAFLFEYGFIKGEIKILQQKSFSGFVHATPEKLRLVSEFLVNGRIKIRGKWQNIFDWEGKNFTKAQVKALMQESFSGFALTKPERLQSVAEFLVNGRIKIKNEWQEVFDWEGENFTKVELKMLMEGSFRGFADVTLEGLQPVSEFLINEYDFTKSKLKALMEKSFQGFANATPEGLQSVSEFLTNEYNFKKSKLKALMEKSFQGFANATPEGLQSVSEFLTNEYNFKKSKLKALMEKSFQGFANATPEGLQSVSEFLINEYDFTKSKLKALMEKSFQGFASATPDDLQSVSEFLVNGKIRINGQWQEVFDWEGENFTKAQVKELMQKSFSGFASATPDDLQSVSEFLVNGKIRINGQWQEVFDWEGENFTKAQVKELMQKSFDGFARANLRILKGVAESGINIYIEKEDIKKKMQHNIGAFLDINFNELTSLISSMQEIISLLPITQKQQWEKRLKQTLLDHLLEEDLIERLQSIKNEMTSSSINDPCVAAALP